MVRWVIIVCTLLATHPAVAQTERPDDAGACDVYVDGSEQTCSLATPGFVCFSGCNRGSLSWTNWTDPNQQGVLVQFSRPKATESGRALGPRSCVKLVVTEARNVLGYILNSGRQSLVQRDTCGERIGNTDANILHWDDPAGRSHVSWFNATGENSSVPFELALLDDVDQTGFGLQLTLRPNPLPYGLDSNKSAVQLNFSSFKFDIESCNITAPVTDRALFLTVTLDLTGLVIAFVWVTCSWAFFGRVRQWRDIRESRRQSSRSGGSVYETPNYGRGGCCGLRCCRNRGSGLDDDMLDDLLGHQNAAMDVEVHGDEDESESQHAVLRKRARQRAWRANFMANHRLTWPYYVWIEPDSTILRVAGQRALQYMEFQWAMIRLLLGLCIPMTVIVIVNWQGTWCQDRDTKAMTSVVDPKWGIPLLDGVGGDSNDLLCRLSSNNIAEEQVSLLWIHLGVTILFSVLTYAVSKRDILGRTKHNSTFLKLFQLSKLDALVPSFWQGAHCHRSNLPRTRPDLGQDERAKDRLGGGGRQPEPQPQPVDLSKSRPASPQRRQLDDDPSNDELKTATAIATEANASLPGAETAAGERKEVTVGSTRPASPTPSPAAGEDLDLANRVQGGNIGGESCNSTGTRISTSGTTGGAAAAAPRNLRETGFEYARNISLGRLADIASGKTSSDRHHISPARYALMVRRVSTRYETNAPNGWLRSTLYRVFHRPPHWTVVDILVFRSSKWNQCTAFIVFESPETPLDIIRRHRDEVAQRSCAKTVCSPFANFCRFCVFLCPELPCQRARSSSSRGRASGSATGSQNPVSLGQLTDNSIFGWSPDTDRLGMPKWDLQPGPMKEDLEVRLQKKGRMRHLNRPEWQRTASVFVGTTVLIIMSAFVVCSSTFMGGVVKIYNEEKATATDKTTGQNALIYNSATGAMEVPGASSTVNFFASYLPTLVNFVTIVGILPTLIDVVAYLVEPHYLKSDVHRSVLRKNLGLLLAASLIFPSLALHNLQQLQMILFQTVSKFLLITEQEQGNAQCTTDATSVVEIHSGIFQWFLSLGNYPLRILYNGFGSAFSGQAAGYFYRYMTHASLLGLGSQLMLMPDKFYTVLSFVLRRKHEKRLVWEFALEYNYAYYCSTLSIILVYSIPHPPILLLGLCYATMRAFGDKYALLFAHEGNLDSHFTDVEDVDAADADDDEGEDAQSGAHYHARTLNLTVHHFLLASIALVQVAMYGYLFSDPNSGKTRFKFAWVALLLFFCSILVFTRRVCSRRSTKMEATSQSLPAATVAEGSAMPDVPSGFGYYNDDGTDLTIDPTGSLRLTQHNVPLARVDGWTLR